jgi:elongation factor P
MYGLSDLKVGMLIELDGAPHLVVKAQHAKLGRGGAILRTTLKNLITKSQFDKTFKGDEKFLPADLIRRKAQVLFKQNDAFTFMDLSTFEQFNLDESVLGDNRRFLKEGDSVDILYFNDQPLQVALPIKMNFKVIEAEPNVKGDSATTPSKNIVIETGYQLKAPIFVKVGDTITIDTRDGSYVERAN